MFILNNISGKAVRDGSSETTTKTNSHAGVLHVRDYSPAPAIVSSGNLLRVTSQIAKQYRDKTSEMIFGKKPIVPWMKWREIELVQEILTRLQPMKCLEWGAGYSTVYFPRFLPAAAQWISVEHDDSWMATIEKLNNLGNVTLSHVPPDRYPWTDAQDDGGFDDLKSYIEYPARHGKFDFILVDGRARLDCLTKAAEIISDRGVLVMHDANRARYGKRPDVFRHQVVFEDYRDYVGGFWIGSIGRPLDSVLDLQRLIPLWQAYASLGKTRIGSMLRV